MPVPFQVNVIEETVDGRVYVEWETIADDGLPLVEGDYFEVEASEAAVIHALEDVQARRARLNATPKTPRTAPPARKQSTARLTDDAKGRIAQKVRNE